MAQIHSDLTSEVDLIQPKPIPGQAQMPFIGIQKSGQFDFVEAAALEMLHAPNPHGRPNSDVIRPYRNASDLTGRPANTWSFDFSGLELSEASLYEAPFEYVDRVVKPYRQGIRRERHRLEWWLFGEAREGLRAATSGFARQLVVPVVSKHHLAVFVGPEILASNALVVLAFEDYWHFGLVQSGVHQLWARRLGTQLRESTNGSRYTPSVQAFRPSEVGLNLSRSCGPTHPGGVFPGVHRCHSPQLVVPGAPGNCRRGDPEAF